MRKVYAIKITRPNGEIKYVSGNNLHKNMDFCTTYTDQTLAELYRKSWEKDCGVAKAELSEIDMDEDWNILLGNGAQR